MALAFKIVRRDDGWHVLSEDGEKHLGGPYRTESEAVERLRQVEGHKAQAASTASGALHTPSLIGESKAMTRAFSIEAPHRLSAEPSDCWDQVAKFGEFVKDDGDGPQIATFNLQHLGEFMSNFARQVNPLWADTNHDFGEANAKYDALALVVDGKPIRVVTRGAPEQKPVPPPRPEQLVNPDSGRVEDGLYAHRYEVTPQGQEKLPNISYVSPLFLTSGKDEQGHDIGYVLLNIAWTNGPFLDGMAPLKMFRLPMTTSHGAQPMNEYLKRYGVNEQAAPDQLHAAMKKYAEEVDGQAQKQEEEMTRYRRFAEAMGGDEKFRKFMDDPEAMKRFRKFMEEPDGDEDKSGKGGGAGDEGDKQEMTAMAKLLGVEPKLSAIREKVAELRFTHAPKSEFAALREKLADLEARDRKREESEREAAVLAFARKAITERAWDPDDEAGLVAFYKASPDAAQKAVERNKKQKTWDRVIAMQRLTAGGAPIGKPDGEPLNLAGDDPAEIERRVDQAVKKIAEDEKVPYPVAMTRLKGKHPELYAAYAAARQ